jgi:hypothetical protein
MCNRIHNQSQILTIMSQTAIELRQETDFGEGEGLDLDPTGTHQVSALPPVDGGKDAWLFLAAAFMVDALTWGESESDIDVRSLMSC